MLQGESVSVRVRQDAGQLHFASDPPQRRPRHAFLPRWHFDMLGDTHRNNAYQAAIENAVIVRSRTTHQQLAACAGATASTHCLDSLHSVVMSSGSMGCC